MTPATGNVVFISEDAKAFFLSRHEENVVLVEGFYDEVEGFAVSAEDGVGWNSNLSCLCLITGNEWEYFKPYVVGETPSIPTKNTYEEGKLYKVGFMVEEDDHGEEEECWEVGVSLGDMFRFYTGGYLKAKEATRVVVLPEWWPSRGEIITTPVLEVGAFYSYLYGEETTVCIGECGKIAGEIHLAGWKLDNIKILHRIPQQYLTTGDK